MEDPQGRIERLEEALLYLERAAEVGAEQTGDLFRRLDALARRLAALESAAAKPEAGEEPGDEAGPAA